MHQTIIIGSALTNQITPDTWNQASDKISLIIKVILSIVGITGALYSRTYFPVPSLYTVVFVMYMSR